MKLSELPPVWRAFLGGFEGLRRLGYESKDIYANFDSRDSSCNIAVSLDGGATMLFQFRCGDAQQATFDATFAEVGRLWNEGVETDRKAIYQEWLDRGCVDSLVSGLVRAGISWPSLGNRTTAEQINELLSWRVSQDASA